MEKVNPRLRVRLIGEHMETAVWYWKKRGAFVAECRFPDPATGRRKIKRKTFKAGRTVKERKAAEKAAHAALPALMEVAERVRTRIAGEITGEGPVTVSVGVAEFPAHGDTPEAIIASADAAMYAAKREGRNRVKAAGAGSA